MSFATNILKEKQHDNSKDLQADNESEKTIDDDWFNISRKKEVKKAPKRRSVGFARVLAGEIEKPGSYSIRTLKTLGELDQNTAILFKKLCSACIFLEHPIDKHLIDVRVPSLGKNPGANALKKYGLTFTNLNIKRI